MKKTIKDMGASVRARLLALAKKENRRFDDIVLRYGQERLLYRISVSEYKDKLILKGGLLFFVFNINSQRPTKDIDLLGIHTPDDQEYVIRIFKKILTHTINDGIVFDTETIGVQKIKEDADYEGVRVILEATLAGARIRIQVDIGFGDVIIDGPLSRQFPTLLDFPAPNILVYSPESSIAEKFEAMVRLGFTNSRMKDFYDIHFLAGSMEFTRNTLKKAIETTLKVRKTERKDYDIIFFRYVSY